MKNRADSVHTWNENFSWHTLVISYRKTTFREWVRNLELEREGERDVSHKAILWASAWMRHWWTRYSLLLQDFVKLVFLKYYFNLSIHKREKKKIFTKKVYQSCLFKCKSLAISSSLIKSQSNLYRMVSYCLLVCNIQNTSFIFFKRSWGGTVQRFLSLFCVWQADDVTRGLASLKSIIVALTKPLLTDNESDGLKRWKHHGQVVGGSVWLYFLCTVTIWRFFLFIFLSSCHFIFVTFGAC